MSGHRRANKSASSSSSTSSAAVAAMEAIAFSSPSLDSWQELNDYGTAPLEAGDSSAARTIFSYALCNDQATQSLISLLNQLALGHVEMNQPELALRYGLAAIAIDKSDTNQSFVILSVVFKQLKVHWATVVCAGMSLNYYQKIKKSKAASSTINSSKMLLNDGARFMTPAERCKTGEDMAIWAIRFLTNDIGSQSSSESSTSSGSAAIDTSNSVFDINEIVNSIEEGKQLFKKPKTKQHAMHILMRTLTAFAHRAVLLSNRALCNLKLNPLNHEVLLDCHAALTLDPMHAKAAYYQADALCQRKEYDLVKLVCDRGLTMTTEKDMIDQFTLLRNSDLTTSNLSNVTSTPSASGTATSTRTVASQSRLESSKSVEVTASWSPTSSSSTAAAPASTPTTATSVHQQVSKPSVQSSAPSVPASASLTDVSSTSIQASSSSSAVATLRAPTPNDWMQIKKEGETYYEAKQFDKAIAAYTRALHCDARTEIESNLLASLLSHISEYYTHTTSKVIEQSKVDESSLTDILNALSYGVAAYAIDSTSTESLHSAFTLLTRYFLLEAKSDSSVLTSIMNEIMTSPAAVSNELICRRIMQYLCHEQQTHQADRSTTLIKLKDGEVVTMSDAAHLLKQGQLLLKRGKGAAAIKLWMRALTLFVPRVHLLIRRGCCHMLQLASFQGLLDEHVALLLESSLDMKLGAMNLLSSAFLNLKEYETAKSVARRGLKITTDTNDSAMKKEFEELLKKITDRESSPSDISYSRASDFLASTSFPSWSPSPADPTSSAYLTGLKKRYPVGSDQFTRFLTLMEEHKRKMTEEIAELFGGETDLIIGFKFFMHNQALEEAKLENQQRIAAASAATASSSHQIQSIANRAHGHQH